MNNFEIQSCLDSMEIIVDTREQPTQRARKRYSGFSVPYRRCALDYGDYTYNFRLPCGEWLYGLNTTLKPHVVVERKMDLGELSQNFTRNRRRFEEEFEKVKAIGGRIYLLVENASWENLLNGKYKSQFNPKAFTASVTAYMARYGAGVVFCKEESSGRIIKEILYRELKERLERGEYDG